MFRKPGKGLFSLYFNVDEKWTLGKETTTGNVYDHSPLSMNEANLDLPSSSVWTFEESDEGSPNVEVTVTA